MGILTRQVYELGGNGVTGSRNDTILAQRNPASTDVSDPDGGSYQILQPWRNTLTGSVFQYLGAGNWVQISSGSGEIVPITPFVVGPAGTAGYQTIQSAIDAASAAANNSFVFVQPGTYTENLTLVSGVYLIGASPNNTTIVGVHTPPASGTFYTYGITYSSATHILSSAAAGSASLVFFNCNFTITNGYAFSLVNWTGTLQMYDCGDSGSTNSGVVNNTGGSAVILQSVTLGAGTGNAMITSGAVTLGNAYFLCPWSPTTGTVIAAANVGFSRTTTLGGNTTGTIRGAFWETGATAAITMSSTAAVDIVDSYVNSSAASAIAGAGAGLLTLGVEFKQSSGIAGTLTIASTSYLTKQLQVDGGAVTDFIGTGTLTAGTVTIANTNIAATDRIFLSRTVANASTALGMLSYSISAGASFTVTALETATPGDTEVNDVSSFAYLIVRQV